MGLYSSGPTSHISYPDMGNDILPAEINTAFTHDDVPRTVEHVVTESDSHSILARMLYGSDTLAHRNMVRLQDTSVGATVSARG